MKVNGETLTLSEVLTLTEFLAKTGYKIAQIVVEMNGKIIPKGEYETVLLNDEDTIEILSFMGGGCCLLRRPAEWQRSRSRLRDIF